jgi:hypothetical protein
VTVVIDGRSVESYNGAYASAGRVYAPLRPFVTALADRIWFDGDVLVIVRDGRSISVRMHSSRPDALDHAYVPLAAVLRSLGETVQYDSGRVIVHTPAQPLVATPTPFDPFEPQASPSPVFTPTPPVTPRPVWTGSPIPRRTPLPYPTP